MFLLLLTLVIGVLVGQHVQISFTPQFQSLASSLTAQGRAQLPRVLAAAQSFSNRTQPNAITSFPSVGVAD